MTVGSDHYLVNAKILFPRGKNNGNDLRENIMAKMDRYSAPQRTEDKYWQNYEWKNPKERENLPDQAGYR
jgi:hypothetical protein